jgi:hypothetical protein
MPFSNETVSLAGSGLVFQNSYSPAVSDAYHGAILRAENALQAQFTTTATISVNFDIKPLDGGAVANNAYFVYRFDYSTVRAALVGHATTPDDMLAVAGLPTLDPSNGLGFAMTGGEAQALGLIGATGRPDDVSLSLSSTEPWTFGDDAVGAIEHELTEGGFGRVQDLGVTTTHFSPFDLFRFTASGQRDYTGGADGQRTYFGIDGAHVSAFAFHNALSVSGANDGGDFGDWAFTFFDAFGGGGGGVSSGMSAVDLQVLDVLGWTPTSAAGADDFANSFSDAVHQMGQLTVGVAKVGHLELIGDRDWFKVQLNAGTNYLVTLSGQDGGGGSLDDPVLTLHDASGAQVTITGGLGADNFHGSQDAGIDKVMDFSIAQGDRVQLDPGTTYTMSQVGADTVLDMGAGNQMILVGVQMSSLLPSSIFLG